MPELKWQYGYVFVWIVMFMMVMTVLGFFVFKDHQMANRIRKIEQSQLRKNIIN